MAKAVARRPKESVTGFFELDPNVRYVAVSQSGRIVEMGQNPKWPSYNPVETDRMEELIVNPVILELAKRRGDIDLDGIR